MGAYNRGPISWEIRYLKKILKKIFKLIKSFNKNGYKSSSEIGQKEFRIFPNKKSSSGNFDTLLCNKLFEILNLNDMSSILISEISESFLLFEEEMARKDRVIPY